MIYQLALMLMLSPDGANETRQEAPVTRPNVLVPIVKATKSQPIDKSLQQLLDEGYSITSMSAGIGFIGFVLNQNKSWIICTIVNSEKSDNSVGSNCASLN
ncbi:hypothetical protein ACSBM8_06675 [Sphingomonas sp. ASY06-1R]|uniref:hypothetical protein n=1 Tax=Sphingomonas sp. ASY06-1R TaxID=3445771 RepID=UPI003FA2ED26